jgi:hypothetical protein
VLLASVVDGCCGTADGWLGADKPSLRFAKVGATPVLASMDAGFGFHGGYAEGQPVQNCDCGVGHAGS